MWLRAAAEEAVQGSSDSQPVIVALISALSAVVVAAFGALVALARRDSTSTTASPPVPDSRYGERVAVLEQRAEDSDQRDALQDRRLEALERHLDRRNPDWRP